MIGLGTWTCGISTPLVKDKAVFTISDDNGKYKISLKIKTWDIESLPIVSAKEFGNTLQVRVSGEIYKPGTFAESEMTFDGDHLTGFIILPLLGKLKLTDGKRVK
jgi:hypothetical protein